MTRSRAPHGARGLKYTGHGTVIRGHKSRPARGAWIEIYWPVFANIGEQVAPRTGRVD